MKNLVLFLVFTTAVINLSAQSCEDMIDYVKSKDYGTTYYSYSSDAISKVTFYDVTDENYNNYYFAIVVFKSSYTEYVYQVSSNTENNYSFDYMDSAGKAFWKYIHPSNRNLNCAPDFD